MTRLLIILLSAFFFAGCDSYRETVRGVGHATGAIEISDIRQANQLRDDLPVYLGLPSSHVRVEAGSGVTHVTISGVTSPADRQTITTKIQELQSQNPKMNSIKLRFQG